jgi:hypothetical protein
MRITGASQARIPGSQRLYKSALVIVMVARL